MNYLPAIFLSTYTWTILDILALNAHALSSGIISTWYGSGTYK